MSETVRDHACDTGHFDRTICPEPCGAMHSFCATCGDRQDACAHDPKQPAANATLTDDERAALGPIDEHGGLKQGYYVGWDATGVTEVDQVLAALGYATKAYHNTSDWHDEMDHTYRPIRRGESCVDFIQRVANASAAAGNASRAELLAERDAARALAVEMAHLLQSAHPSSNDPGLRRRWGRKRRACVDTALAWEGNQRASG